MATNFPKTKPEYYMPLSSGSLKDGLKGPSPCAFSSPNVPYSKETQDFVKLLMAETKLTTTQKQGFQALLRSGEPMESRSTTLARRNDYLCRRIEKGRALGLDMPGIHTNRSKNSSGLQCGGKRTFDTIRATGVLEPSNLLKTYVPVNKEAEKARFSYKMAYGHEPTQEIMDKLMGKPKENSLNSFYQPRPLKSMDEVKQERLNELMEEIRERVEFLESMRDAKREKEYHGYIVYQIREKLGEVKSLFPEKMAHVIQSLRLVNIDPFFAEL